MLDSMVLLSAADVLARHDDDALARLDERPGLRQAFEAELGETRPERRTLYFDAVTGWRFVDLCDLCGGDLGYLEEAPALAALCESCGELELTESGAGLSDERTGGASRLAG
jgi:hypothetical protein